MNEQDWADRFSRDVDSLLNEAGRMDSEPLPTEYHQALELARTLATTDFSAESRVRHTLRCRLLSRPQTREGWSERRRKSPMRIYVQRRLRRRLLVAICGALALFLVMLFLDPGGPAGAAHSISDGVKLIVLGAYSTAQRIEASVTGQPPPDDGWDVALFPGFGIGGNGLPGTNPTVESVMDFEEAQAATLFHLRASGYLPEGYALREIKLAPIWTGAGALLFTSNPNAFLFYEGPGGDIVVVQQPVGPQPSADPNVAVGTAVGFLTNGTLEEIDLSGRIAAWADDRILMWEEGGVSYMVGGLDLSLEEAIRIAESLE
ncbi:MAG: DUF4367 domain-containing protein [Anaerolineae bacterium]